MNINSDYVSEIRPLLKQGIDKMNMKFKDVKPGEWFHLAKNVTIEGTSP